MKNNQSLLKKIENLLKPESTILVDLHKKIDDNTNTIAKKEKSISDKSAKIASIKADIDSLNAENAVLLEAFGTLKDKDLKLITGVLKLNLDVKKDLDKLTNQLPLQIEIRKNDINDLEIAIKDEQDKLTLAKTTVKNLEEDLESALQAQKELQQLIKEARDGSCIRTRGEVVDVLKQVLFTDQEAYDAAKMIMFPEDDLMPFFKDFKFTSLLDSNEEYVDLDNIATTLETSDVDGTSDSKESKESKENATNNDDFLSSFEKDLSTNFTDLDSEKESNFLDDASASETSAADKVEDSSIDDDYQKRLEDETPISFEELKRLFEEDLEDKDDAASASSKVEDKNEENAIVLDDVKKQISDIIDELNNNEKVSSKTTELSDSDNELVQDDTKKAAPTLDEETKPVNFDESILTELGKSKEDISLIKPFDTTDFDVKEIKSLLAAKKMKANNIACLIYKNGLAKYLENIALLAEFDYRPSEMELQKNGVLLSLIDSSDLRKNLKTLKDYKINLKMATGHLAFAVLGVEPNELVKKIDMIIENGQEDLFTYSVNVLALDVEGVLNRIAFCKEYNIPYTEEKNNVLTFNSYVFNQEVLEKLVEKEVDLPEKILPLTDELKEVIDGNAYTILKNNLTDIFNVKLTDANMFEEYTRLEQKLESVCVCKGDAYIIEGLRFSRQNTKRNLITLVNNKTLENDKELLIASLFYNSYKSLDDVKVVLESL